MRKAKIIDTNVLLVANGLDTHIDILWQEICINFLKDVRKNGIFTINDSLEILSEYNNKLSHKLVPYGNAILKYIQDHQYDDTKVLRVSITQNILPSGDLWYNEIDSLFLSPLLKTDTSDRKFIATHHASTCQFPIVNATDSDWKDLQNNMKLQSIDPKLLLIEELL